MMTKLIREITYPILKSRPDFLIIGAQKAATTSLYNYLVQHPQIYPRKSFKEVRYFDRTEHYSKGYSWYLGNFPFKFETGNRLNCDASPNYLYYEDVPRLIQQDLGEVKMIAILREPVSRAYSAWQMFHSFANIDNDHLRRFYDPRNFDEAIAEEFDPNFDYRKYPFRYDYVGRGRYIDQLENYYKYFKKENLLILTTDQLNKDLGATLNYICEFLNIDYFPKDILLKLEEKIYNKGKYKEDKKSTDSETLEMLKEYFIPFNQKLYDLLGCRYNW
ncbi:sulfotransferase [Gloeothece citriformis PCC 7424]|uniref:Sulfotransferase n=1 Tax=Gloeothece citriformis (strain PCC 7424) TaxID=65393 RepID=B7KCX5_GLOC7|nr:sulfotransferase domain-containing protein [Gloeothece citriformis]ACK73096.1 sulfotransferase [Gloeothece citriformis PCC 7424]